MASHGDDYNNISVSGPRCDLVSHPSDKTGFNLLDNPFWIGIIVILGVVALIGIVAFIRRKCIANFDVKCCLPYHSKHEEKGK